MAKNWKVGEAVKAIQAGNKEDILDIGRRFPLFANLAAQVNEAGVSLLECVPEYCSARKIESVLKGDVQDSTEDDAADEEEEKEVPKKAEKKAAKPAKKVAKKEEEDEEEDGNDSLESKSAKELFEMCKEAGLKVKPKQDKSVYIEALNAANNDADDEEDDWEEEEEEAPKKPAKKAAAKPAKKAAKKDEEEDDDDDWSV